MTRFRPQLPQKATDDQPGTGLVADTPLFTFRVRLVVSGLQLPSPAQSCVSLAACNRFATLALGTLWEKTVLSVFTWALLQYSRQLRAAT